MRKVKIAIGLLSLSLFAAAACGAASAAPHKTRSLDPGFAYNPDLAYLRALAGLHDGKKMEFIFGRNALRTIARSSVGYQSGTDPIRASTARSAGKDLETVEFWADVNKAVSNAFKTSLWPYVDRKQRARNYLDELPPVYVPGFAYMDDDGAVVADPDPFIRLQLIHDRYELRGGSGGGL